MVKHHNKTLAEVLAYCQQQGIRLTPLRQAVLDLIYQGHAAMGAYDVLRMLRETKKNLEAASVYRVLDFLLKHHLIHRVESLNAYVPCSHEEDHHSQFLLCKQCGESAEILDHAVIHAIKKCLDMQGFSIEHGITEIRGLCYNCNQQPVTA